MNLSIHYQIKYQIPDEDLKSMAQQGIINISNYNARIIRNFFYQSNPSVFLIFFNNLICYILNKEIVQILLDYICSQLSRLSPGLFSGTQKLWCFKKIIWFFWQFQMWRRSLHTLIIISSISVKLKLIWLSPYKTGGYEVTLTVNEFIATISE